MKKYLAVAALLLLSFSVGYAVKPRWQVPLGPGRTDTVAAEQLLHRIENLTLERDGLRARLESVQSRPPAVVVRTDTVVTPPDTVFLPVLRTTAAGRLTIPVLIADSLPGTYRPEVWRGFDTSDCDDGWSVQDGVLVCDRARLGHIGLGVASSFSTDFDTQRPAAFPLIAEVGLYWTPSYRSTWEVSTSVGTDQRVRLTIRKLWRLF